MKRDRRNRGEGRVPDEEGTRPLDTEEEQIRKISLKIKGALMEKERMA